MCPQASKRMADRVRNASRLADDRAANQGAADMMYAGKAAVAILTAAVTGLLFGAQTAVAEESGSFCYFLSGVHNYITIDHAGGRVTGGSLTGTNTVLRSSGEPFAEGSDHLATCVVYAK